MKAVLIDATPTLAAVAERLHQPDDLPLIINRQPDITPDQVPAVLGDAAILIVDHTHLPTDIARQCQTLRHVVFLGTGPRSYMDVEALGELGIEVLAWNRSPKQVDGVRFVPLEDVLAKSHVVSLHLLLTDETRGFLSAERLAQMRDGSILINTARGALVDEAAMIAALRSGKLAHAGLDVYDIEPMPAGHPLTQVDNVTLSAHSAFRTPQATDNLFGAALNHCRRISGQGIQA